VDGMQLANGADCRGSIERVSIHDCIFSDCDGPISMFGSSSKHIHDVSIDNIQGTTGEESAAAIGVVPYTAAVGVRECWASQSIRCRPGALTQSTPILMRRTASSIPCILLRNRNARRVVWVGCPSTGILTRFLIYFGAESLAVSTIFCTNLPR
jgi:hypothetical protein